MRYQVWHGYAITRFNNRMAAKMFAKHHNGIVIAGDESKDVMPERAPSSAKYTIRSAKNRIRVKKGWDIQSLENSDGVFFLAHLPAAKRGAVQTHRL